MKITEGVENPRANPHAILRACPPAPEGMETIMIGSNVSTYPQVLSKDISSRLDPSPENREYRRYKERADACPSSLGIVNDIVTNPKAETAAHTFRCSEDTDISYDNKEFKAWSRETAKLLPYFRMTVGDGTQHNQKAFLFIQSEGRSLPRKIPVPDDDEFRCLWLDQGDRTVHRLPEQPEAQTVPRVPDPDDSVGHSAREDDWGSDSPVLQPRNDLWSEGDSGDSEAEWERSSQTSHKAPSDTGSFDSDDPPLNLGKLRTSGKELYNLGSGGDSEESDADWELGSQPSDKAPSYAGSFDSADLSLDLRELTNSGVAPSDSD